MNVVLREVRAADAEAICRIYNPHVLGSIVTFEEVAVTLEQMQGRIAAVSREFPWLVAERGGAFAGYAYVAKYHERSAFRHSVESAIYLSDDMMRKGLGTELYRALLTRLPDAGVHAVLAGVSLPNASSVALHEKCGFRKVAHFEEVGFKFGRWIDVGYWQITL